MRDLDAGAGVLVLTDLYGSTPSNIGAADREPGHRGAPGRRASTCRCCCACSTTPTRNWPELALTAAAGARNGVILDTA